MIFNLQKKWKMIRVNEEWKEKEKKKQLVFVHLKSEKV